MGNNNKGLPISFDLSKIGRLELIDDINSNITSINKNQPSNLVSATELLNRKVESLPCLVEPIFPKVGVCALAGGSDVGKSTLLRQLGISVVLGDSEFLGFKINATHNKAIYVSTEDDDFAISYLLNKANKVRSSASEAYRGLSFIFDTTDLLNKLEKALSRNKVDLIVVDAFADLYGKSMNEANQVRNFLNQYSQLAIKYQCLIIFLHHTGKRTETLAPSKHNVLGSQGFESKMRLVIELRADYIDPGKRHLCIVKANYLSKEYKSESYVVRFDENLQFHGTDERCLFEDLKEDNKASQKDEVLKLKEQGQTQIQIATTLKISQPTVSRILREA